MKRISAVGSFYIVLRMVKWHTSVTQSLWLITKPFCTPIVKIWLVKSKPQVLNRFKCKGYQYHGKSFLLLSLWMGIIVMTISIVSSSFIMIDWAIFSLSSDWWSRLQTSLQSTMATVSEEAHVLSTLISLTFQLTNYWPLRSILNFS